MDIIAEISHDRSDRILLDSGFQDKDLVKTVPGARWDSNERKWHVPLTWASCKQLRGSFGDRLKLGARLKAWAWDEYRRRIEPALELREQDDTEGEADLRPYQRVGVEFLSIVGQALLADEPGSGKTVQAIRAMEARDAFPAIVIAPNSVTRTWQREFAKWAPDRPVTVVSGSASQRRKQIGRFERDVEDGVLGVLVINWESVRTHSRLAPYGSTRLKRCEECGGEPGEVRSVGWCEVHPGELNDLEWAAVVADEAHRMKNPKAKQTRATWAVAHQQDALRFALTGTPIANTPDELWSLLHFLSPEEWPAKTRYIDRYCQASYNPFGGMDISGLRAEMQGEFYSIFDPRFLRRTKAEVMTYLPAKTYQKRFVEMSPAQRRTYEQMRDHYIALLDDGDPVVASNPLVHLTRLTQFASASGEIDDEGELRLASPSNKIDELVELLEELGSEPVVVFAESRQLIELGEQRMASESIPYVSIRGGVSTEDRDLNIQSFAAGHARVCFVTLGAGGEGVDGLQHGAKTAVFLQRSWSMVKNLQAEDRIHRGGQDANVLIIDMLTPGTIEEYRDMKLADKQANLQQIVRDHARQIIAGEDIETEAAA